MNYAEIITESVESLLEAEKRRGSALYRDRARFLRLLKTGECKSQACAGAAIGLCERHAQRLWQTYRQAGFDGLMQRPSRRGFGKLTSQQISHLRQFLHDDQAQTLEHIQTYLSGSLGVEYTIGGVSDLCKRLGIKRKRGRPVNVRQKPGAVDLFKKTLDSSGLTSQTTPSCSIAAAHRDELRAGTRTELGHKWTPMGHRPVAAVKIGYDSTYLYLTLCPFTGKGFAAFLPRLNAPCFTWFVGQVQDCLQQKCLFVADGATAHVSQCFDEQKLTFIRLPAACPELNGSGRPPRRAILQGSPQRAQIQGLPNARTRSGAYPDRRQEAF